MVNGKSSEVYLHLTACVCIRDVSRRAEEAVVDKHRQEPVAQVYQRACEVVRLQILIRVTGVKRCTDIECAMLGSIDADVSHALHYDKRHGIVAVAFKVGLPERLLTASRRLSVLPVELRHLEEVSHVAGLYTFVVDGNLPRPYAVVHGLGLVAAVGVAKAYRLDAGIGDGLVSAPHIDIALRNEGAEVAVSANTQHLLNVVDADWGRDGGCGMCHILKLLVNSFNSCN